jgi:acyl-CoA synthetase (AMP-forming)/AMP-acid ligase II
MKLWATLERAASLYPQTPALIDGARTLTYVQARERCERLHAFLEGLGLEPGMRVAVLAWNGIEFFELYYACLRAGLVLVPLNVRLSAAELVEILRDAEARFLFADRSFSTHAQECRARMGALAVCWHGDAPAGWNSAAMTTGRDFEYEREAIGSGGAVPAARAISAEDLVHLYYTSGTTGRSKGVMLTNRNVATHALGAIAELQLSDADRWAHIAPMFHLADAWATFAITWAGGTHVFLPRFEPLPALDLFVAQRITITNLVPTMLNLMLRDKSAPGRDYSALRAILSGGAPIAPTLVRAIQETFCCTYIQTYGMTETSPYLTLSVLKDHLRRRSPAEKFHYSARTGRPFATVELRVVGEDGREVAADDRSVGEIRVRGDTVTPGYWNRPEETRAAFVDGWLCTGDLATIDAEGYVQIVDRKKDMILSGGENVYSTEVENALYAHPAVLEAAVVGRPDEILGERVYAAVVLRTGAQATSEELRAHCRTLLAGYKTPKEIDFLNSLPRTGTGKIAKRLLRNQG